ncbi:hypothetical protein CaCOL14_008555 [Colletotrichum acutatum]
MGNSSTSVSAPPPPSESTSKRVTGSNWGDLHPIGNPATATWHLCISGTDAAKLLLGYQPTSMDDRWMSRSDGPDAQGTMVVHVYRSWTGHEQFQIRASTRAVSDGPGPADAAGEGADVGADITEIMWDRGEGPVQVGEQEAKDMMQFSTLFPTILLGASFVAADYCTQALDPEGRKSNTGFRFESVDNAHWKWQSRDLQVVTTLNQNCQIHQGGGGGPFAATICIDFDGNYACWVTPAKNQVCDLVFEQNEAPIDVCKSIKNIWGWVA